MYCQVVIFYDVLKRLGEGFYTIQDFFDRILRRNGLTESEINKILNTLNSRTVKKLIEKYGETMDNQNHGKNLLIRLEMTKRIFIKEI